ncbi:MAG: ParB/RepB/Spo0J family partition protein [Thermoleophilaceae bacterium]
MHESLPDPKGHPRGMGRGLSAILPRTRAEEQGMRDIPVDLVLPNAQQPRRDFEDEALLALAESIRSRGVLQPIVVRPLPGGQFELIAGERRLRASKLAAIDTIPAVVRQTEDSERLDLALAENMARVDLNPIEEARACAMLVDDLGLTKEEVGRRVGKSRVAVSNLIRLLELPDEVLDLVAAGELSEGHGRAILTNKDHEQRKALARDVRDHGWSVRETEAHARGDEETAPRRRSEPITVHPDQADALAAAEDALTAALGHEVRVRARGDGARAELKFDSPGEAIELAERLLRGPVSGAT